MTKGENRISSYSSNGYELSPDVNDDAPNAQDGFEYDDFQHCRLNSIFLLPNNDFKNSSTTLLSLTVLYFKNDRCRYI